MGPRTARSTAISRVKEGRHTASATNYITKARFCESQWVMNLFEVAFVISIFLETPLRAQKTN